MYKKINFEIKIVASFLFAVNIFLGTFSLQAQDIHYAQFYNAPLNLNPGLTGVFNGDKRFMLSYRNQWSSVPVPWTTFSGTFDRKFYPKYSQKYFLSGGLNFNYDRQGLADLDLLNLNVSLAYTRIFNKQNLLTIGVLGGFATRGYSPQSLTWDAQWNGTSFDPNLTSGETNDIRRVNFFENAIGLNYRWQKSKRTKLDLGAGMYHVLQPSIAFADEDDIQLPRRLNFAGVGSFQVADPLDIQLHGFTQFQDDYREYLGGALLKIHINQQRGKEFELHVGASYRTSKSLIPVVAVQYKNIYASFNYDIDMSEFEVHTAGKGGPELHFNYIITDVKPLSRYKVCPIY